MKPHGAVLAASGAFVVGGLALALAAGARWGVAAIACACIVYAAARAFAPERVVPGARSRTFDVVMLLAFAVILSALLPWAGPGLERPVTVP